MGLSFLEHKDNHGASVYMIHNGSGQQERQLEEIKRNLERNGVDNDILILDGQRGDGAQVMDFYDILEYPAVLVVRDNDQIYQHWTGTHLPDVGSISYAVRSVSL